MGGVVALAGSYANHLHLAPDNHASTSQLNFYSPDALDYALHFTQSVMSEHCYTLCNLLSVVKQNSKNTLAVKL